MATKTASFTLNRTTAHSQQANVAPGPVVMMASADEWANKINVWINVDAEDQAPEDWKLRTFMLLGDYTPTPNGYIHQGSMIHPSFGALHLYEYVEPEPKVVDGVDTDKYKPILSFTMVVNGKLVGSGEVDREGAIDLVKRYANLGYFGANSFIDRIIANSPLSVKFESNEIKEDYLVFTFL